MCLDTLAERRCFRWNDVQGKLIFKKCNYSAGWIANQMLFINTNHHYTHSTLHNQHACINIRGVPVVFVHSVVSNELQDMTTELPKQKPSVHHFQWSLMIWVCQSSEGEKHGRTAGNNREKFIRAWSLFGRLRTGQLLKSLYCIRSVVFYKRPSSS